jgi:hypothetical protein
MSVVSDIRAWVRRAWRKRFPGPQCPECGCLATHRVTLGIIGGGWMAEEMRARECDYCFHVFDHGC